MNVHVANDTSGVVPFSLKDAPSLIERVFPSMKVSAEAQKERKSVHGQTLTPLGSYWKGRKPLVLVRACILGCLLPATDDPEADLAVFERLMAISDASFQHRVKRSSDYPAILNLPHEERVRDCLRPEELPIEAYDDVWPIVNSHLGTSADSFELLVEQLGIMRFGKRPTVADTFSGSGSIPFEAARLGCDAVASDLNPIACMLSWGALNLVGEDPDREARLSDLQRKLTIEVDEEITRLGIEHDENGNRAKVHLYCLETRCPETGWMVPMLPSRVLSTARSVIVDLVPDASEKRYAIQVRTGATAKDLKEAEAGTVNGGRLTHPMNENKDGVAISSIRGDRKGSSGAGPRNALRQWERTDFTPHAADVFQERLYAIQWIKKDTLRSGRQETFFASVSDHDLAQEEKIKDLLGENLAAWQQQGLIPQAAIETGVENEGPIRTNGWCYWHHMFTPRALLLAKMLMERVRSEYRPFIMAKYLDNNSKSCRWAVAQSGGDGGAKSTFDNQALKTIFNWANRSFAVVPWQIKPKAVHRLPRNGRVIAASAVSSAYSADIFVTDPPYADAVRYEEITEFFIAWLGLNPPKPFDEWVWDSRRRLAIKGKGEEFRSDMVAAYKSMAERMPENGVQVVMFTHQDGKVWSDMAQIFWGAGLQVMADWYIATETTSELKKGGYVQGTHCIVLRKRPEALSGYSDEISQEVKEAVAVQIEEMVGLNQTLRGHGRSENVFNDADLQMAGYAAALRVLTSYAKIDGKDMTVEAMRPRAKNERTLVDDIIEYAVQVANEHLVPEGMDGQTWRRLAGTERFYLKMLDIEQTGARKVDNYQNFAKAFRVADHGVLMASEKANDARLKSAADFGKRQMGADEFGSSLVRAVLYAVWEMGSSTDDELVMEHLRGNVPTYLEKRQDLQTVARYIAAKRRDIAPAEAANASLLADLIRNERLG